LIVSSIVHSSEKVRGKTGVRDWGFGVSKMWSAECGNRREFKEKEDRFICCAELFQCIVEI
jgi:hypothetical protein